MEDGHDIESVPDARWKEILREEAEKMAQDMKSEKMMQKDLGGVEVALLSAAKDLFRRALERYQREQAEMQP